LNETKSIQKSYIPLPVWEKRMPPENYCDCQTGVRNQKQRGKAVTITARSAGERENAWCLRKSGRTGNERALTADIKWNLEKKKVPSKTGEAKEKDTSSIQTPLRSGGTKKHKQKQSAGGGPKVR